MPIADSYAHPVPYSNTVQNHDWSIYVFIHPVPHLTLCHGHGPREMTRSAATTEDHSITAPAQIPIQPNPLLSSIAVFYTHFSADAQVCSPERIFFHFPLTLADLHACSNVLLHVVPFLSCGSDLLYVLSLSTHRACLTTRRSSFPSAPYQNDH